MSTISTDVYQSQAAVNVLSYRAKIVREVRIEIVRKSIHLLIAFTPTLTWLFGNYITFGLLAAGVLCYTAAEFARSNGFRVPVISRLTELASRDRDRDHFVLGPVTLGLGAMLAIMLYPNPAAALAVYALAFGDGFASLVGKAFGRIRLPFTGGKSLEGSLACFFAVLVPSYIVLGDLSQAIAISLFATFIEAMPTGDFDNIVLPALVGSFVMVLI